MHRWYGAGVGVGGKPGLWAMAATLPAVVMLALGNVRPAQAATPTLQQLVGQRLVVAFSGTTPSATLLGRIRLGRIGGVILFGGNVSSKPQLTALAARLQAAAKAGGQPRLLITTDQEGGQVKRLSWAPPNRSARQLGALPAGQVGSSGLATGKALRAAGVNLNLAPVADVPTGPADFIWAQDRAFSTNRFTVSNAAAAFAQGLERGAELPALKHFPGLGLATRSTDTSLVKITASKPTIQKGLLPYKVALRRGLHPVIMLSTAVYTAYDFRAAAWSPPIIQGLLRGGLAFRGVTITDSLDAAAHVRGQSTAQLALKSAQAGADLLLVTGSDADSQAVYSQLLRAARSGTLPQYRTHDLVRQDPGAQAARHAVVAQRSPTQAKRSRELGPPTPRDRLTRRSPEWRRDRRRRRSAPGRPPRDPRRSVRHHGIDQPVGAAVTEIVLGEPVAKQVAGVVREPQVRGGILAGQTRGPAGDRPRQPRRSQARGTAPRPAAAAHRPCARRARSTGAHPACAPRSGRASSGRARPGSGDRTGSARARHPLRRGTRAWR